MHAAPRELPKLLDEVEQNLPANLDIHVVMDNAATHRTKLIRVWFAKRRRWHIHFTPTSSSWINQVERFFALPAEQQIKRAISIDQTSRRHFRFVGTLLSSDDQPSRTDSIVLAILASPFKSKREFLWMFIWSLRGKLKLANLSVLGSDRMDNL